MKQVLLAAAAAAVLIFPALGSSAGNGSAQPTGIGPLGAVPPHVAGKQVGHLGARRVGGKQIQLGATSTASAGPTSKDNLTYGNADQLDPNTGEGGPVMHSSKVYVMFWVPAGYTQGTHQASYQLLIQRYFSDVAAASGGTSNVYSALKQYFDTTGNTAYSASYGGSAIDTNAFPSDGCTLNQYDGWTIQNTTNCLDDSQLQTEIQSFADGQGWDHGPNVQIFLFTPQNVASCISDPSNTTFEQDCSYSDYCAYHSAFFSGGASDTNTADEYIYANMPWPNQQIFDGTNTYSSDCDGGDHPNGDGTTGANDQNAGDEVLGVTSHEHNEAWSDPLGTGWWVDSNSAYGGEENGDLCAWYFPDRSKISGSPAIGSGSAYNQVINGHDYFIQGEWSNRSATGTANSGCVWNYAFAAETTAASITGTTTVGQTLTGDAGVWAGSPTAYKYEWQRCDDTGAGCKTIKTLTSADTTATYTLVAADDKHTMRVRVTGSNGQGVGAPALSAATGVVDGEPVNTVAPAISGTALVGQTLTGDVGTWSPAATFYKIAWLRCNNAGASCKSVKSATLTAPVSTAPTYALAKVDDKLTIRFQVTASNAAGVSDTSTTSQTSAVGGEPEGGTPAITGTTTVGQTLTSGLGSWTNSPTSYTYMWERCPAGGGTCRVIRRGTSRTSIAVTYILAPADDKANIKLDVTASNASGVSDDAVDTVGPIAGEPASGGANITGTATVGQVLTGSTSGWSPAATRYKFEWLRCDGAGANCRVIKSVTQTGASVTYTLGSGDHGKTIRLRVTATNTAGSSIPVTSSATSTVP